MNVAASDSEAVSVVIPTYNGASFVGEALHSVFTQTRPAAEVVVVDDASTDDTAKVIEQAARTAPVPVRLLRCTQNSGGPARPLNTGVEAARGPLIAILDQDDVFAPRKLEVQVGILANDPELMAVGAFCARLQVPEQPIQPPEVARELRAISVERGSHWRLASHPLLRLLILRGNFLMGYPGFLFRKSAWQRRGGVNEAMRISSDYDLLCWLALQGPLAVVPEIHYFRRDHQDNLCKQNLELYIETMRVKATYVNQERWLLDEPAFVDEVREELFGLAYWLRQAGRPWMSLRYCFLARKLWGWDRRTLWLMAKLLPQGVLGLVGYHAVGQRG